MKQKYRLDFSMLASKRFVDGVKFEILNDRLELTLIVFASGVREQFLYSSVRQFLAYSLEKLCFF